MSDYYGDATLEDWLAEEVFEVDKVSPYVVNDFEQWREGVESDISAWMATDDGEGNRLSWRGWGRGFNTIHDDEQKRFDKLVGQHSRRMEMKVGDKFYRVTFFSSMYTIIKINRSYVYLAIMMGSSSKIDYVYIGGGDGMKQFNSKYKATKLEAKEAHLESVRSKVSVLQNRITELKQSPKQEDNQ